MRHIRWVGTLLLCVTLIAPLVGSAEHRGSPGLTAESVLLLDGEGRTLSPGTRTSSGRPRASSS